MDSCQEKRIVRPLLWLRSAWVPYATALRWQKQQVESMWQSREKQPDRLLFLEHPSVYTVGRSGRLQDVLRREVGGISVPVVMTDRGGQLTYHGPGQLVAYLLRDLRPHALAAVRQHVYLLEEVVIRCLAQLDVSAQRDERHPGVWVGPAKIAALGVRIRQGITYHGVALNRDPALRYYEGIVPCGLPDRPVTSLAALGVAVAREPLEALLLQAFCDVFQYEVVDLPLKNVPTLPLSAESDPPCTP
ncbi:MAG: lipoyl(octanoyl) transferase LipB [Magnetococcales bacterium]|nr:lipoyl(octanoyl) transferase LipB [Magnetococcales bacterium]MBF0115756.1 lipoyl(octanoyl) transferase LipB [Magnetococcales bacterium]